MPGILIADDEAIVRATLVSTIERSLPELAPFWEAGSGEEAVTVARQMRPWIVLVDIRMPGMDGLEAAQIIRKEVPDTRIITLTAYDEFSYCQDALRLGATDYLLKPVRPSTLIDLLKRLYEEIQREEQHVIAKRQTYDLLREILPLAEANLVQELVTESASIQHVEQICQQMGKRIVAPVVLVVQLDNNRAVAEQAVGAQRSPLASLLREVVHRALPDPSSALTANDAAGTVVVVMSVQGAMADRRTLGQLAQTIRSRVESSICATASIGIGRSYSDLEQASISFREAVEALDYRLIMGCNSVIHIDDVARRREQMPDYPIGIEQRLLSEIRTGNAEASRGSLSVLVNGLLSSPIVTPCWLKGRLRELLTLISRAAIEAGVATHEALHSALVYQRELDLATDPGELRDRMLEALDEMTRRPVPADAGEKWLQQAVAFMRENLHRSELDLKEVAGAVHISPSHLTHLFKARTSMGYVKYLTFLRVEEAKRLLATTDLTISAVSVAVGYEDHAYFHRVFRRATALTPAQYRNLMRANAAG